MTRDCSALPNGAFAMLRIIFSPIEAISALCPAQSRTDSKANSNYTKQENSNAHAR